MRRTWGVALLVLTLTGVGCRGANAGDEDSSRAGATSAGDDATTALYDSDADEAAAARPTGGASGAFDASVSIDETLPDLGTKVVRTADLRVEVEKGTFGDRLRSASALARTLGG